MSIPYLLNPYPGLIRRKRGKKPVIYLFSPEIVDASVHLSLVPEWSFSSVFPVVPVQTSKAGRDAVQWNVRTHMNGSLTELCTGMEVSYLFWEADVVPEPCRASLKAEESPERFNPASCDLSNANAVLLPAPDVVPYLNNVLEMLGLHTEARTSFITFWIPYFFRHKYVAFRFLPQSAYSEAAPLTVDPEPDVVTRIFMLFMGVADEDRAKWGAAELRARQDPAWWKWVVGIEEAQFTDETLFRVLEWGGMEI
ncbi:hypothetical protein DFH07DRAFT_730622 [Mycena maculata]|uniref:Uncharacterized protein n=1 Tax=Mycena maculata TaxID=230809 RepID=A0AAD7NX60_9AGAR|nr:hypothetical protein DFH07DRAFT_730622 [Mycena maculata]